MINGDINIKLDYFTSFDDFLSTLECIGSGREGSCYKYFGRVLKVFDGQEYSPKLKKDDEFLYYNTSTMSLNFDIDESLIPTVDYIMRYSNIQNDAFVFADGVFRVNDKIKGLLMPFITLPVLDKFNISSTKFDSLIKSCKELTKNIKLISDLGIEITDPAGVNFFFDGKTFKIGDTLDFVDHDINEKDEVFKKNIGNISNFLVEYFTFGNIKKSLKLNKDMIELYRSKKEMMDPSIYFIELKKHLNEVCDEPINSISKANRVLAKKMSK